MAIRRGHSKYDGGNRRAYRGRQPASYKELQRATKRGFQFRRRGCGYAGYQTKVNR